MPALNLACDGYLLKRLARGALIWLDQNYEHVNRLNVFPVPDGDTGTNMLLTMRQAYEQIEHLEEHEVGRIAAALADGALNGARGNSGTILSQLWRGFADGLYGHGAFEAEAFVDACRQAVAMAYQGVSTPAEGTILTVAREATDAVTRRIEAGERDLVMILKTMVTAARSSLRRTPDLLPVLRQAGVVDSGGQGLVYILEGMFYEVLGKPLIAPPRTVPSPVDRARASWEQALEPQDDEGYGYDVQFRMHGSNLNLESIRHTIENMGWSACVVGSDRLIKVHVHVHDPGKPISYAISQGVEIDDIVVENMQRQYRDFVRERHAYESQTSEVDPDAVAVVAVAPGGGLRRLFAEELGAAWVISGGQTMNPSTGDFLEAINALPHRQIVLLPNNKNIILAAQQAATMTTGKTVRVLASRTIPQGISAMLALANLGGVGDVDDVLAEMEAALGQVVSAEVTTAIRDVELGGISVREGQLIGLLQGVMVVAGDEMHDVVRDLLRKADADKRELVTLYYGNDTHKAKAQVLVDELANDFPRQSFEIIYGGQALYPYLISIE